MLVDHVKRFLQSASSIEDEAKSLRVASTPATIQESTEYDAASLYEVLVIEPILRQTTRQLFIDGHYALAVEEAFKCLNNVVKERSRVTADGAALMRTTFSPKNPVLKLNDLKTNSQQDQQQGYMDIFAGCMTGIRNPRAHEHSHLDEPRTALELLALANHLLRLTNKARRSRKPSP